ncbi:amidase [Sporobolomyces salmoneus]|uniref:amidase n=1 Tax=Sporobolomyces salmoneus TaxID=183962 RepID=UPI00317E27F5
MPSTSLRIACLQLEPVFKNPNRSIKRAEELLEKVEPGSIDFLVLPEMAFTGYCFKDREDIAPFIEEVPAGKSTKWAMKTARKYKCYVQIGVPTLEQLPSSTQSSSSSSSTSRDLYYNSIVLVNPLGRVELVYHKHFLFETDQSWATPGPSFLTHLLELPPSHPDYVPGGESGRKFKYSPAICMDLNAEAFDERLEKFELSNFVRREQVDLVVASNAWLDSETKEALKPADMETEEAEKVKEQLREKEEVEEGSWEEVRGLVSYWVYRMSTNLEGEGTGMAFVVCNRIGREGDSVFAGSSCMIQLGERPTVMRHASKKKEELIIAQIQLPSRD